MPGKEVSIQTDITIIKFNKLELEASNIKKLKNAENNRLDKYLERISFDIVKPKGITLKSLLNLISELYNDRIESDFDHLIRLKIDNISFDRFFYNYMLDKFKLKKLTDKNIEEVIKSVLVFAQEDERVNIFRKFLCIGDDGYRKEILEYYLLIIKGKILQII